MKRKSDTIHKDQSNTADHSAVNLYTSSTEDPLYGSQKYWENRYQNFFDKLCLPIDESKSCDPSGYDESQKDQPEPGHAWYFTYDELQPLIFPLVMGDKSIPSDQTTEKLVTSIEKDDPNIQPDLTFHILEIGCGDVPLGIDLCREIYLNVQNNTTSISKYHVVSSDYCDSVIQHFLQRSDEEKKYEWQGSENNGLIELEFKVHDARDLPYGNQFFSLVLDKGTIDAQLSDGEHGLNGCTKMVHEVARILKYNGNFLIVSHFNANEESGVVILNDVILPGLRMLDDSNVSWLIEVHGNCDDDVELDEETEGEEGEENEENGSEKMENVTEDDDPDRVSGESDDDCGDEDHDDDDDRSDANVSLGPAVYIIKKNFTSQGQGDITIEFHSH